MTAAAAAPKKSWWRLLFEWSPFLVPLVAGVIAAVPVIAAGELPDSLYAFTDPVVLPILAGSLAFSIIVFGLLPSLSSFGPKRSDAAPPPRRRLGLRIAAAVAVVVACLGLRIMVIRSATPTRQAIDLVRRHAVAGKAIGTPVEVGWDVRGWIHADAEVNDEDVPPSIDASVPVRGPRGSGELAIDGRVVGGKWVLERVVLRLDRGERIEIVSGAVSRKGIDVDPTSFAYIGGGLALAGLLVIGLLVALRGIGSGPRGGLRRALARRALHAALHAGGAAEVQGVAALRRGVAVGQRGRLWSHRADRGPRPRWVCAKDRAAHRGQGTGARRSRGAQFDPLSGDGERRRGGVQPPRDGAAGHGAGGAAGRRDRGDGEGRGRREMRVARIAGIRGTGVIKSPTL
ncbi:MAG: cytochrome c oxidase assembly factor Coa1 family protein [Minicystis sp.]